MGFGGKTGGFSDVLGFEIIVFVSCVFYSDLLYLKHVKKSTLLMLLFVLALKHQKHRLVEEILFFFFLQLMLRRLCEYL